MKMHFYILIDGCLFSFVIFSLCTNGEFDCPRTVVQCKKHCTRRGFGHAQCYGRKCKCYFERKTSEVSDFKQEFKKQPVLRKPASSCHTIRLNGVSYLKCIVSMFF